MLEYGFLIIPFRHKSKDEAVRDEGLDYGSLPRRQAGLSESGKSAEFHAGSGFIWRIPDKGSRTWHAISAL
jgi:hypothetical protein